MSMIEFTTISQSTGEEYKMVAAHQDGVFTFTCTCPAGSMHQMCKHRRELLTGAPSSLDIQALREWYAASQAQVVEQEIVQVEAEAARLKKRLSALKAQLGRMLAEGC